MLNVAIAGLGRPAADDLALAVGVDDGRRQPGIGLCVLPVLALVRGDSRLDVQPLVSPAPTGMSKSISAVPSLDAPVREL